MTVIYSHEVFQRHETGNHPETPKRLSAIDQLLNDSPLLKSCRQGKPKEIGPGKLEAIHHRDQIQAARSLAEQGGGLLDADTVLSTESHRVAITAAGTAVAAVDEVISGKENNALCLIRPPGHHATARRSMGFCIFNNVALAAAHALCTHDLTRVLVVDWDVHHGNGTQDIFYERDDVHFFSIHRYPFYPGTGARDETGQGRGRGATLNIPIAYGTKRETYLDLFRSGLETAAERAKPDLIIISAGFDAHGRDPIGNLGLEAGDFAAMTHMVKDVASSFCQGKIVSCLEGGYNLEALAQSVEAHLQALIQNG